MSRYVTGLMISPNKTLQGIYDLQVWGPDGKPTRRAMHAGVFEARWDDDRLMELYRAEVARGQGGGGRQVISLDWTFAHHDRGPEIFANTRAWDYVEERMARFQTVVTAVVSNRQWVDGLLHDAGERSRPPLLQDLLQPPSQPIQLVQTPAVLSSLEWSYEGARQEPVLSLSKWFEHIVRHLDSEEVRSMTHSELERELDRIGISIFCPPPPDPSHQGRGVMIVPSPLMGEG